MGQNLPVIDIRVDTASAQAAIDSLESELRSVEDAQVDIEVDTEAESGVEGLAEGLLALRGAAAAASGALGSLAGPLGTLTGIVAGLGLAALAKQLFDFAAAAGEAARETNRLAAAAGVSAQEMAGWQAVARASGADTEALAEAAGELFEEFRSGVDPSSEVAQAISRLGVSIADASGALRPMSELLPEILTRLGQIADPTERAAAGAAIFAGEWEQLGAIVAATDGDFQGAVQRMQELGAVMSPAEAQRLGEMGTAFAELGLAVEGLKRRTAAAAAPLSEFFGEFSTDLISRISQLVADVAGLDEPIAASGAAAATAAPQIALYRQQLERLHELEQTAAGAFRGANIEQLRAAADVRQKTIQALEAENRTLDANSQKYRDNLVAIRKLKTERVAILAQAPAASALEVPVTEGVRSGTRTGVEEGAREAQPAVADAFSRAARQALGGVGLDVEPLGDVFTQGIEGLLTGVSESIQTSAFKAFDPGALLRTLPIDDVRQAFESLQQRLEGAQLGRVLATSAEEYARATAAAAALATTLEALESTAKDAGVALEPSTFQAGLDQAADFLKNNINAIANEIGFGLGQAVASAEISMEDFGRNMARLGSQIVQRVGQMFGPVGSLVGGFLGGLLDILGIAEEERPVPQALSSFELMQQALRGARIEADTIQNLEEAIQRITAALDVAQFSPELQARYEAALESLQEQLESLTGAAQEAGKGMDKAAESAERVASSLTNIPTGFRTALARFNATVPGLGATSPAQMAALTAQGATIGTQVGTQNIEINLDVPPGTDARQLVDDIEQELQRRQWRGGGTLQLAPLGGRLS